MSLVPSQSRRQASRALGNTHPNAYTRAVHLATQVLIEWVLASGDEPATWVPGFELLRAAGFPAFPWHQLYLNDTIDSRCNLCGLRVRFFIIEGVPPTNPTDPEAEDVMFLCPRSRPRPNPDKDMSYEKALIACIKKSRAWSEYVIAIWHTICDREEPAHEREERQRLQVAEAQRIARVRTIMSYEERTRREKEAGERALEMLHAPRIPAEDKTQEDKVARRSSFHALAAWFKRP